MKISMRRTLTDKDLGSVGLILYAQSYFLLYAYQDFEEKLVKGLDEKAKAFKE